MRKLMGLRALLMAGVLAMPGNLGLAGSVYAQETTKRLSEEQYEELKKKRQEQWQTLEKIDKDSQPGERLKSGVKHRDDALKRQKAAEQRLKEMEE